MKRNPFVYKKCDEANQAYPDIQVDLVEQYSQAGEDIIVGGLLSGWSSRNQINLSTQKYLEVGANHPFATSSTYLLSTKFGMTGVLVEANNKLIPALESSREQDIVLNAAIVDNSDSSVSFYVSNQSELSSIHKKFVEEWKGGEVGIAEVQAAPAMRINELLYKYFDKCAPIFVAIDVEGADLKILQDLDWTRWRPFLVQTEPSDHFEVGTSQAMIDFMGGVEYSLVARTDINLIFADNRQLPRSGRSPTLDNRAIDFPRFYGYPEGCRVGIVTRTKDRPVLLRRALESVKNQTYPHWSLIVVNDGGERAPVDDLIENIFGSDSRVAVVHHDFSRGMEAASNSGLVRLTTDLAAIHDDDDSWAPEMLAVSVQVLRERNRQLPSVRGVVMNLSAVFETVTGNHIRTDRIETWQASRHDALEEGPLDISKIAVRNQFPPIAFVFDLPVCKRLGMFDTTLPVLGDWDFHLRFASEFDIWIHPESLAFYHHRPKANGSLGNTVHAGRSLHLQYNTLLRNKWMRASLGGAGPASVVATILRESTVKTDRIEELHHRMSWSLFSRSAEGGGTKRKTALGQYLSELNKRRKAWQKGL